jgi:hypothetical protein
MRQTVEEVKRDFKAALLLAAIMLGLMLLNTERGGQLVSLILIFSLVAAVPTSLYLFIEEEKRIRKIRDQFRLARDRIARLQFGTERAGEIQKIRRAEAEERVNWGAGVPQPLIGSVVPALVYGDNQARLKGVEDARGRLSYSKQLLAYLREGKLSLAHGVTAEYAALGKVPEPVAGIAYLMEQHPIRLWRAAQRVKFD